ncbi:septum formation initiator family protein [Alphaproteobacteria bacterium]|nr:septum formation initiator family protein [Alphaproteobacteria bacterium]
MFKYWIRKNIVVNLMTFLSFIVFSFFVFHIFFGERSLWKIFKLNQEIARAQQELNNLFYLKSNTSSEINLFRDNNLDPDIISEISHKLLGLIHSDQIVIDITK